MPYNDRSVDQIVEYNSTIGSIQALIDSNLGLEQINDEMKKKMMRMFVRDRWGLECRTG